MVQGGPQAHHHFGEGQGAIQRQTCSAGDSPAGARARRPVAWMAGRRETEPLEPIDEAIGRMVSEFPGRNVSERRGSLENAKPRRPSVSLIRAKAAGPVAVWLTRRVPSGGVGATAR